MGNKLICLNIYTGKQSWIYEKPDIILEGYNIYFLDNTIYILAGRTDHPPFFHSGTDLFTTNDSLDNTGLILINEKNGKELKNIDNIIHRESWGIDYVNKNVIFLISHKAISAFDTKSNQELWHYKKAPHPKWLGYGSKSELKDTVIQYSFICGKGDTIFLSRKTSSIDYKIGEEKIVVLNLKNGDIIAEFFASGINDFLLQYDYVQNKVSGQELFFIKRNNLSIEKSWNGYANYALTCIDLKSLELKWEYNLSSNNKEYDVRDFGTHLYIDSTSIYFTDYEKLICISRDNGQLLWEKKITNADIMNVTVTKYFIICSIYEGDKKHKFNTIILDKSNISTTAYSETEFHTYKVDNAKNIIYLVDSKDRLLKIKAE
jgi:outer membrane protein assembly factor BamB